LQVNSALNGSHVFEKWINYGATGYVVSVRESGLNQLRAMKILRPGIPDIEGAKSTRSFIQYFAQEIEHMADVSHEGVVHVYTRGSIRDFNDPLDPNAATSDTAYYIMEFIDGQDLDQFLVDRARLADFSGELVKQMLEQLVTALSAIHERNILHGDIKPGNVCISTTGKVKLTDFGFAKTIDRPAAGSTFWCQDPTWLHPELRHIRSLQQIEQPADTRSIIHISSELLKKRGFIWELHSLGKTIQFVLDKIGSAEHGLGRKILSDRDKDFLGVLCDRLIDIRSESAPHLDTAPRLDMYTNSAAVLDDLRKLARPTGLGGDAPEMQFQFRRVLRVPLCAPVPLSRRMQSLVDHPMLQRLSEVTQLGVVGLAFRAAKHSRFEHSMGVVAHGIEYLRALWSDPQDAYFREVCTQYDCELFLVSALLHDLGQYPFAHAFEESEKSRSKLFSHEDLTTRLIGAEEVGEILVNPSQMSLFGDESVTTLHSLMRDRNKRTLAKILRDEWGIKPRDVVGLLGGKDFQTPASSILRSALDGPIDVDKLDYLRRDAYHIGLAERLDIYDFLRSLTVTKNSSKQRTLAMTEHGIPAAQDLHMSRYALFVQVYWSRTARSAERMLRYAVDTLRELGGDDEFSKLFFASVLTSNDLGLLTLLRDVAASRRDRRGAGCHSILEHVIRRELYQEAYVVDPRDKSDEELHDQLSSFWSNSLEHASAEQQFSRFLDEFTRAVGSTSNVEIAPHQLLIDIPDPRADRPAKYDVLVQTEKAESGRSISTLSPIWKEFSTLFRLDGRRIRIFIDPDLMSGIRPTTIKAELRNTLSGVPANFKQFTAASS
jgi:HD superfamily phosphohydrolase